MYNNFTYEDTESIGKRFLAKCVVENGMENFLTHGKTYEITITPRILPMSPLCSAIGDNNIKCECHLTRFEKIEALP